MNKVMEKKASIIWPYKGIDYNICTLVQIGTTDGFSYEFIPNYRVLKLINKDEFCGIQGIDLDLKKEKYIRKEDNTFIYERVPPRNRANISEYLRNLDLDYYDPLEILLRKKTRYSGDPLNVVPFIENKVVSLESFKKLKKKDMVRNVLSSIANGDTFIEKITYKEIITKFNDYMVFYNFKNPNKKENQKVGRPKILIENDVQQIFDYYKKKEITLLDALTITGLSRRTFFRKLKEYNSNKINY